MTAQHPDSTAPNLETPRQPRPNEVSPKPSTPASRDKINAGQAVLLAAICGLLLLTMIWAGYVWTETSAITMSIHGWIALGLGTFFSLLIGCGLMALMFFSSRSGHDDSATPKIRKDATPGQ